MKIAMAQMQMGKDIKNNLRKSIELINLARGCDLIFFPEVQLSPFFAQYKKELLPYRIDDYITDINSDVISVFKTAAKKNNMFVSPNLYVKDGKKCYDMSLFIDNSGELAGKSKMVNVADNPFFREKDYYTPSDDGYKVYDTPFGKVGIVICYDRHFPESVSVCKQNEAKLVIIPTANTVAEDMHYFENEIKALAKENKITIAMCNRVGIEDKMYFAGQSLIVSPNGDTLLKAGGREQLIMFEVKL